MGFIKTVKEKLTGVDHEMEEGRDEPILEKKPDSAKFEVLEEEVKYRGELTISSRLITFGKKLRVEIVPAEENDESFRMYQRYTKDIHQKKEKTMSSYVNFLCLRALKEDQQSKIASGAEYLPSWDPARKHQQAKSVEGEVTKMLGCFHWKYYLEG